MAGKGAAPRGEFVGKSSVFSTRIRPDLRKKLDQAARQTGRSVSQEVEHRLRRSFIEDETITAVFGDRQTFALMRAAAAAIQLDRELNVDAAGNLLSSSAPNWLKDPERFETAIAAILAVFEKARPYGPIDYNPALQQLLQDRGERAAFEIWRKIQKADTSIPAEKRSDSGHVYASLKTDLNALPGDPLDHRGSSDPKKE